MGRLSEAQGILQHAIEATPADPRPRFGLLELKMRQKDYDGARQVATDALTAMPGNPRMLEALVAIDLRAHGIKAALATAETLKQDPHNMPAALMLPGTALAASGDKAGAAAAFVAAFHAAPSEQTALTAASTLDHAGQPAESQKLLADWTAQHPDSENAQRVLAAMALAAHRNQEAGERLGHVLAAQPADASALNNLAWVKLADGDAAAAFGYAQRAYYLSPGAETEDTLGWVMAARGDTAGAVKLLEQAAAMKPSPPILYHYAFALNAQARPREAREALDKALASKAPFEERPEAEKLNAKLK